MPRSACPWDRSSLYPLYRLIQIFLHYLPRAPFSGHPSPQRPQKTFHICKAQCGHNKKENHIPTCFSSFRSVPRPVNAPDPDQVIMLMILNKPVEDLPLQGCGSILSFNTATPPEPVVIHLVIRSPDNRFFTNIISGKNCIPLAGCREIVLPG